VGRAAGTALPQSHGLDLTGTHMTEFKPTREEIYDFQRFTREGVSDRDMGSHLKNERLWREIERQRAMRAPHHQTNR
jgi:hypothetical protein